jgi:CRISPR-associated helicase Cas3
MRTGIMDALFDAGPSRISVLVAPTGYGKTSAVHYSWRELLNKWGRVVHVLPLRALVSNVCSNAVDRGVPINLISYQAMLREIEKHEVRKSPYMFSPYAVTTYDSFLTSMYVAPVAELSHIYAHRDTGLLVAAGGVLLDEVHLVLSIDKVDDTSGEWKKALTSMIFTLEALSFMDRPTVLVTATLSREVLRYLEKELKRKGIEVVLHLCLGERGLRYYSGAVQYTVEHGLDKDYDSLYDKYSRVSLTEVSKEGLEKDVLSALDHSQSVLVFCNTVHRAVDVYKKIKEIVDVPVLLLHARLAEKHREAVLRTVNDLLGNKSFVLISTQCLEAGADLDFDTVVTEVAPPGSLIQRAGRAIRNLRERLEREERRPQVIISISEDSLKSASEVYPAESVKAVLGQLKSGTYFLDWRFGKSDPSFIDLLATVSYSPEIDFNVQLLLKGLLELQFVVEKNIIDILGELDDNMRGSLLKDAALIPLIVEDDVVTVSLDYLNKHQDILELRNGRAVVILDNGERTLNLRSLLQRPLSNLHKLSREGKFLGLKVRESAYSPEVGLP